jgi:chromosome segregation protein
LEITGFKSFARSTRFQFTPGITALVGPNGSGKSNVVDAIRWCLGEQSVRDLRGQRTEDVIYAGSRRVLGAAEVSLMFAPSADESSFRGEVSIARRLYRSGESEYLVDGRKARLRDLTDRLRGLGIDGSRHIVVTQGMADALLSAAPAERRSLLEQAAGLSGYRVRRDEARQKLGTTEQNIATIEVVLQEMEPRSRSLRRQARAVQDRAEAQSALHGRLHDWYASRWSAARSQAHRLRTETESIAQERLERETRLTQLENAMEVAVERERDWQQRVDMLIAANHTLEKDRDAALRVRSETEGSLISARRQLDSTTARVIRVRDSEREAQKRGAEVAASLRRLEAEIARLQAEEETAQLHFGRDNEGLRQVEICRRDAEQRFLAGEQKLRASTQHGEETLRRIQETARRRRDVEAWLVSAQSTLHDGERECDALHKKLTEAGSRSDEVDARLEMAQQSAASWRSRVTRLDVLFARTRGAALDAQRRRDAAQRALQPLEATEEGSLLQGIEVRPGWESAIAAALGSWAHATPEGKAGTTIHEDRNPGFATWRASLGAMIGSGVWADDVVGGMPAGRVNPLRTALLVESENDACHLWDALRFVPGHTVGTPGVIVVTQSGVCWSAVGRETSRGDDRAASYLRLKRDVEVMSSRFAVLSARAVALDAARVDAVAQREQKDAEIGCLQAELRVNQSEALELEAHITRWERQRADLGERTTALRREVEELDRTADSLVSEQNRWKATAAELESTVNELKRQLDAESARVESTRARVSVLDRERRDAQHAHQVAVATHRAQIQLEAAIQAEQNRLRHELSAGAVEQAELEETIRRLKSDLMDHSSQLERLNRLLEKHSAGLSAARNQRPSRDVSGQEVREARAAVANLVRLHERAQAEALGAQRRIDALVQEIAEELQIDPGQLTPSGAEPPSEVEVKRLRARAMQYADADPSVVDEARELAERHTYLLKHVEDLRSAAQTLRTMMEVADVEMRTQFDVAFAAVNEEFSRVFEVMLQGGRARLEQVEGGGVEVIAQLPGKRSRSSAAFSGGERSLIASSLLFGVLKMRPTPFCVLDEVDAALDEGNVDRYLVALRDISQKTQAIVVTHNRATMAAADVLYGLTMDAEGASDVLSLRLESQVAG